MRRFCWLACAVLLTGACSSGQGSGVQSSASDSVATDSTEPVEPNTTVPETTVAETSVPQTTVAATTTTEPTPMALLEGEPWIVYQGPLYERHEGVGNRLVRPNGKDDHWATPQVPRPKNGWQLHPDWSRDGLLLAFAAHDATDDDKPRDLKTTDLWISSPDGTDAERVLDCVSPCVEFVDPAWSPDGTTIALVEFDQTDGLSSFSLRSMDVATKVVTTLTTATGADEFTGPRWSPDGQRIVLGISHWTDRTLVELTETALAVVDLRESPLTPKVITDWSMWANYPDWHPSEDLIVFSTRPWKMLEGPSNLYTIRPDGSDLVQLTKFGVGETRAVQPTWTPEGDGIIFTAVEGTGDGHPTMAIIQRDGSGLQSATSSGPMFGSHPRLRPGA